MVNHVLLHFTRQILDSATIVLSLNLNQLPYSTCDMVGTLTSLSYKVIYKKEERTEEGLTQPYIVWCPEGSTVSPKNKYLLQYPVSTRNQLTLHRKEPLTREVGAMPLADGASDDPKSRRFLFGFPSSHWFT